MDVERPSRRLDRAAGRQERTDREDAVLAAFAQRPVDLVDEMPAGLVITAERTLGQQGLGGDRPRCVGPAGSRPEPGEGGAARGHRLGQPGYDRPGDHRTVAEDRYNRAY